MSENGIKEEDTFKILLSTDCHLGYMERDAVRGSDSLTTFEEILQIAVEQNVDFILLSGDLFHENKPSRKILHQCMSLLRNFCMGNRPVQFEFLSDQSENFKHSGFPVVNYEDPNLNISLPIFSIHGNHDDPAGSGSYCSLDLLSISGLVNYFGKCTDLESVQISPLLLQKGGTKLALYGLGAIRDERLHRLFRESKVCMLKPAKDPDDWFNVFTLHQNRAKHGVTNYIPEQFLADFLDLIIWGHEHECRLAEEWNSQQSFYVSQPGSSIATSLCHGEAVPKHVGLLQINKKTFKITEIPLKTVRQFYIKDIDLESTSLNLSDPDCTENVINYCKEIIDQFLEKALVERSGHPKQPEKPLIRLRVFYPESFQTFSVQRFGQNYVDRVANPKDIILFTRKKTERIEKGKAVDAEALKSVLIKEGFDKSRVEDLVKQYFQKAEQNKKLSLLSENGISNAVQEYVDKEVTHAIDTLVSYQLKKTQGHLKEKNVEDSTIDDEIMKFREERQRNSEEASELQRIMKECSKRSAERSSVDDDQVDGSGFDDDTFEVKTTKSRGRGRGRGSRGSRGRGRGSRGSSNASAPASASAKKNSYAANNASSRSIDGYLQNKKQNGSSWRNSTKQSNVSSFYQSDDMDEVECIDVSDDEFSPKNKRQKTVKTTSKKGIMYDSSD